jgi:phage shock protein PspC (stress-responsive transcriptional regulator)
MILLVLLLLLLLIILSIIMAFIIDKAEKNKYNILYNEHSSCWK